MFLFDKLIALWENANTMNEVSKMNRKGQPSCALYHRDIGFPKFALEKLQLSFCSMGPRLVLEYPRHAMLECVRDKYGPITNPPRAIEFNPKEVFEMEISGEPAHCTKFAIRHDYGDEVHDIILVLEPCAWDNTAYVKTVWLNRKDDVHKTLRSEAYAKP